MPRSPRGHVPRPRRWPTPNHQRTQELQEYAQIAYEEVPTQEEMLSGGQPIEDNRPHKNADPKLTREIDDTLYEAAQQGNIGGG